MDQSLSLLIEMRDKLSKPLTDQQKALKQVNTQIKELIQSQKRQEKASIEQAKQVAKAKKEAQEWAKAVGSEMVAAAGTAATAVAATAVAIAALAGGLVYATAKTIEFVSAQSAMGEKLATSYVLGTRDAAQASMTRDMVDDLAARMRVGPEQLHKTAQELLSSGVKPQLELQRTVRAVSELQKTGNEDAANKLKGIFKRNAETRRQFGGRGQFGISRSEAEEVLGPGGFQQLQDAIRRRSGGAKNTLRTAYGSLWTTADIGNQALADVISGGKVGQAAKNMIGGLPEVFERARTEMRRFFQDISKGEGFRQFIGSLHSAIDAFEGLTKAGGNKGPISLLDAGFKLLAKGITKAITLTLKLIIWTLKFAISATAVAIAIKKWVSQGDRLNMIKAALMGIGILLAVMVVTVAALAAAFAVLWVVILLPLLLVVAGFAALGVAIYELSKTAKKYFNKDAWKAMAVDAISGLLDTLVSGARKIYDAGYQLGKSIKDGVKTALDIKSPSREMAKLGNMSAAGFQQGLDNHATFQLGAVQTPKLGAQGAASGMSITWTGNVVIQGGGGQTADELRPMVDAAFADAFEKLQLEMGVV